MAVQCAVQCCAVLLEVGRERERETSEPYYRQQCFFLRALAVDVPDFDRLV